MVQTGSQVSAVPVAEDVLSLFALIRQDGLTYLGNFQVAGHHTQPVSCSLGESTRLLEEVSGGRVARHASEYDASEQR